MSELKWITGDGKWTLGDRHGLIDIETKVVDVDTIEIQIDGSNIKSIALDSSEMFSDGRVVLTINRGLPGGDVGMIMPGGGGGGRKKPKTDR